MTPDSTADDASFVCLPSSAIIPIFFSQCVNPEREDKRAVLLYQLETPDILIHSTCLPCLLAARASPLGPRRWTSVCAPGGFIVTFRANHYGAQSLWEL